jgi:hypothetical protein
MIPKIIVQTSICKPAQYIIELFCKFAPNWKYEHYNDNEILQFFNNNPLLEFPNIIEKFNSMKVGQHKADLFRYYFLYIKGGVFIDSDAMLNTQLDDIAKDYDFFTVNCDNNSGIIFQGFIGGISKCSIIYDALIHAYNITQEELSTDYHAFCKHLYNQLCDENNNEKSYCFPIKLYTEDTYNYGTAKTFDKLGNSDEILLFHYYRYKLILRNPKIEFITPVLIITPCSRPENLEKIRESIDFDNDNFLSWIIIYDLRHMKFIKRYSNCNKIVETGCTEEGVNGHQIRNMALREIVREGLIYFLDDDTIVHPFFWTIVNNFHQEINIYTFNLLDQNGTIHYGNNPTIGNINTYQFIFHKKIINNYAFNPNDYYSDGLFIQTLCQENQDTSLFVNSIGGYYNWLNKV